MKMPTSASCDALPEWTRQYVMLGCRFDPSLLRARGSISIVWRLAPGTGLRSPETGSQDQGYQRSHPAPETGPPAFEGAEIPAN